MRVGNEALEPKTIFCHLYKYACNFLPLVLRRWFQVCPNTVVFMTCLLYIGFSANILWCFPFHFVLLRYLQWCWGKLSIAFDEMPSHIKSKQAWEFSNGFYPGLRSRRLHPCRVYRPQIFYNPWKNSHISSFTAHITRLRIPSLLFEFGDSVKDNSLCLYPDWVGPKMRIGWQKQNWAWFLRYSVVFGLRLRRFCSSSQNQKVCCWHRRMGPSQVQNTRYNHIIHQWHPRMPLAFWRS